MEGRIRLWNPSHPQTVKIAVGLGYWLGILSLLGLGGGGFAVATPVIFVLNKVGLASDGIVTLLNVAAAAGMAVVALGMANDKKIAWQGGAVLGVLAAAGLVILFLNSLGVVELFFPRPSLFNVVFQAIFVGAWVAGMLHPMTRDYVKVWFE